MLIHDAWIRVFASCFRFFLNMDTSLAKELRGEIVDTYIKPFVLFDSPSVDDSIVGIVLTLIKGDAIPLLFFETFADDLLQLFCEDCEILSLRFLNRIFFS